MTDYRSGGTPQWAADPSGRHRYRWWDGHAWTGHVNDGPALPRNPPHPRPPQEHPGAAEPTVEHAMPAPTSRRARRGRAEEEDETAAAGGVLAAGGRGGGLDRPSFFKGAAAGGALVGVIALLAVLILGGDDGTKKVAAKTKKQTTTTEAPTTTAPVVTTTTLAPGRPPSQVRVIVQNGSGVSGAATKKFNELKTKGYTVLTAGNTAQRQGTVVECNTGFEAEAQALAVAVGEGATVLAVTSPPPSGLDEADCVVILGTSTTAST